jgi:hypothetical protein
MGDDNTIEDTASDRTARPGRYAVRVTNHETGAVWAIHDSHDVCVSERDRVLKEWGSEHCIVEGPHELKE